MNPIQAAIDAGTIPPRPSPNHPTIRRAIATRLADLLEVPIDRLIDDIYSVLTPHTDGYALAKALDDQCGWSVDAELVEKLDEAQQIETEVMYDAEIAWVNTHGITQPYPPGTRVRWTDYENPHTGYITDDSYSYPGKSLIKDDAIPPEAARLAIVAWERLELLETTP